ncbi:MAG: hypothetical protein WD904_05940 [Dehalococcoidia bacterium]
MVRNPILFLFSIATTVAFVVVVGGIAFFLLRDDDFETGVCRGPDGEERPIENNEAFARSFDQRWNQLAIQALAGAPSYSITLTESEVTSRADVLLHEHVPVDDFTVCFHDGFAETIATGHVPGLGGIPVLGGLFDAGVEASGAIDVSGDYARVTFSELSIENIPSFIEDEFRDEAERAVNDELAKMPLQYRYDVTFAEGTATVTVSP